MVPGICLLTIAAAAAPVDAETRPGLATVELVVADAEATGYATFQSHNQKVVSNAAGIFISHIRSRNEAYTAQEWRLSRSRDGGRTFSVVYQATHATNPPVLETDAGANVYLVRPDFADGNAYLYRFLAADDYREPRVTTIPRGAAGKFAMAHDAARGVLYYFAHNNTFHVVSLDGTVRRSLTLLRPGKNAVLQYPLLSLARDGALHAAWTTQKHGVYLYWDIHHMMSPDGGLTWRNAGADAALELPVVADDGGPAARVSLDDEFPAHTWLSSVLARDGTLHFLYMAQTDPPRQHYLRRHAGSGKEELRLQPELRGDRISVRGLSGFFAARSSLEGGPLYCVSQSGGRLACLASDDDGDTWYDYALAGEKLALYSIGGARELSADGFILGTVTHQAASTGDVDGRCPVYFFKIRAGKSRARVVEKRRDGGKVVVRFGDVRGLPERVRFRDAGGAWSPWIDFTSEVRLDHAPAAFQLESRLGVVSDQFRCE